MKDIIIIGGGLNGICAGYYCKKNNYNFLILEKTNNIGGVWTNKNVPGIRTDSSIRSYTYSFNKKHTTYNTKFPTGGQITDYIKDTADKFDITKNIKLNTQVIKVNFIIKKNIWKINTNKGVYICKYLINCNGYFNKDKYFIPKFKGIEKFNKKIIHIYDIKSPSVYKNKNVLLVGSGAMAISSMPILHKYAKKVVWLQRSPSYIAESSTELTNSDYILGYLNNNLINQTLTVYDQLYNDFIFVLFRKFPTLSKLYFYNQYKKMGISDKFIKKHLTPKYNPWDQRIAIAVPGLLKLIESEIETHTTTISEIKGNTIILKNGTIIKNIDTIILATGFTIRLCQFDIYVNGIKIKYNNKLNYFKHCMLSGIPNYFQVIGTLHSTYTVKIELLYKYIFKILRYMINNNYQYVKIRNCNYKINPLTLKSNYLKRNNHVIPQTVSIYDIPSLDIIKGNYTFNKEHFIFNNKNHFNQNNKYASCNFNAYNKYNTLLLYFIILLIFMYIKIRR